MDVVSLLLLAAGLLLLVTGGSLLVRGASRMALGLGVSPLVIGLTVVAAGTSAPELTVSILAATAGRTELAVGNVLGSNIFNVLVILGLSACITPLAVAQSFVRREVPFMIGLSLVAWALSVDGRFDRWAGAAFVALAVLYTAVAVRRGRAATPAVEAEYGESLGAAPARWGRHALGALVGLGLLVAGSELSVGAAADLARAFGVRETVVAVLIVAPGTSLPEVATSLVAAVRGERDIAVANVVGSNVFNLLGVLGGTALVAGGIPVGEGARTFDFPVMVGAAAVCLPIFFTGFRVGRIEGALLVAYYCLYAGWSVLSATGHGAARPLGVAVLGFALPLTVLGLGLSVWHAARRRRAGGT